jgi:hypothetical protein
MLARSKTFLLTWGVFLGKITQGIALCFQRRFCTFGRGDRKLIVSGGDCPKRRDSSAVPDIDLLDQETRVRVLPIVETIGQFAASVCASEDGSTAPNWLARFREWGDGYLGLSVKPLSNGTLVTILPCGLASGSEDIGLFLRC